MAGKNFPISLIVKAVDKATAPLRQVSASLGDISKQVASAGKALTVGVTAPLAAMAAGSVAAFGRFEAGMANVSTLVDTSVESMAAMEAGVIAVTRAVKVQPLSEMAEALGSIRGAGISAADQFKVLEGSGKLAAAALGTTAEAADIATSAINAWGLKGAEAEGVYNQVFQAVNYGKMSLSQLARGFGGVAGTVASAGVKLDEYLSSVAALTTTGLPAAEAHTQLRAVISGLTRQTELTRAVFGKLGAKDLKQLIAQSGGLVPALERVKGVLKGNDTQMLNLVGSTEALNAIIGLTGNQAATQKQALDVMRSGTDGLTGAFEKQARTGKASLQSLKNDLEIVAISVGRVLVPVLQQLVPVLERAVKRWESLGEGGQKSIIIMAGAAAALGPTITVIGHMATAVHAANVAFTFVGGWAKYLWMMRASILAGLVPSLTAATASVWGFTVALLANPITWVVAGIVALAGAAYLIYKNWGPIKAFFLETWETVKGAVASALAWVGENLSWTPLGMLVNNWEPVKAYFVQLWDSIVGVFQRAWEKIQPIVDVAKAAFAFSPLGVAVESGRQLFGGGDEQRPSLGAARAAPTRPGLTTQPTETRVVVDFSGMPRGVRVAEAPGGTAPLDLSLGYGMMGG